jgi:hypothetical protein
MAEAVAQFRKGLDQLALLPVKPEHQQQELEFHSAVGGALQAVKGLAAPEAGKAYDRANTVGTAWFPFGVSPGPLWAVDLSHEPRRT